jgi:hypothetical protein
MGRYAKFFSVGGGGGGTNNLQLPIGTVLDTTLRQVQDGLGTGSPLYISTLRVGITSDPSVTTETCSVIQATTTNANLVIAPNGTGALIASIPDGTATGGNARGNDAVDLQTTRGAAINVASGNYSTISGGQSNTASSDYSAVAGGAGNSNTSYGGFIGGGSSNAASNNFQTISGGQSNTASTNSHATVVGGFSNVSSGQYSISGGNQNIVSGYSSVAFGEASQATSGYAIAMGNSARATSSNTIALGLQNYATNIGAVAIGGSYTNAYIPYSIATGDLISTRGDAQFTSYISRVSSTLTSGGTVILTNSGGYVQGIPLGNNRMWKVKVEYVGTITTITGTATGLIVGDTVYGEENFGFKKLAGTSTMGPIMNETQSSDNAIMDTCALVVTAGASQEMALTFTGPTFAGGGSVTMRVVAKIALVEVAF